MQITSQEDQPSATPPAEYFTGQVRFDQRFDMPEPASAAALMVTFEPGARTAWHTHPRGQLIIITSGIGWVQTEGGDRRTVRAGDSVWFEPDERHWHGATDAHAMSHFAVQERENGSPVTWQEHVSDEDYLSGGSAA